MESSDVKTIEQHPKFHEWSLKADYVEDRNSRGRVTLVRRVEICEYCPTLLITIINTTRWEKVRTRYVYVKGVKIVRISKNEHLKRQILATSNLPHKVVEQLRKAATE